MTDDPFLDVVRATVQALNDVGIAYAITGSVASGIYGEPIPSQDIDFVVHMTEAQAGKLHRALPNRFYRSLERLQEATRENGMANLIDTTTGLKVDLSVLKRDPFYDALMSRARPVSFGADVPRFVVVTPEDIILMKLLWRKGTQSAKQWENALSVARVKGARMDWKYLFEQARALQIEDDLVKLRDEAGI